MGSRGNVVRAAALGLAVFALGAIAGGALVAHWSVRASRLHLQMMRLTFAAEQEMLLRHSWQ